MRKIILQIVGLAILGVLVFVVYWSITQAWDQFKLLDPKVSAGLLTAATTVLVATLTVVLGKYYERRMDVEAHYRVKKTEIYDEFLSEFFKLFHTDDKQDGSEQDGNELVDFLGDWQRRMILWGGQDVLLKYIAWMGHLNKSAGNPDARTMFMMDEFFIAIRKDLGHKNIKLVKGTFIRMLLKNPELFLAMAKANPNVTLAELAEAEHAIQG